MSSALLRMCSPVFDRMLSSDMKEAQERVIEVGVATQHEFEILYALLMPGAFLTRSVKPSQVESLLRISDYYEVSFIKKACEQKLLSLPATPARLIEASKYLGPYSGELVLPGMRGSLHSYKKGSGSS